MKFENVWHALREELGGETGLRFVAPLTREPVQVEVEDAREVGVAVRNPASGETDLLAREEFERVFRSLCEADGELALATLAPGLQRCVAVATLLPRMAVDEERGLFRVTDPPSPSRLECEVCGTDGIDDATRTAALRFDATLLADLLEPLQEGDLAGGDARHLVDLYTVLADVREEVDALEHSVADRLLEEIPSGGERRGRRGTVSRETDRRVDLADPEAVREALAERGIDSERVSSLDLEKVEAALAGADVSAAGLFAVDERDVLRTAGLNPTESPGATERADVSPTDRYSPPTGG